MKIKKILFCAGVLTGLMVTSDSFAAPLQITAAKIVCTASLSDQLPLVRVDAGQQRGIESSWIITNTSRTDSLQITQVDSYGMDGKLIISVTPKSVFSAPPLEAKDEFFKWIVPPNQVSRFPHQFSMYYPDAATGTVGTDPSLLRWYNVVFTVKNAKTGRLISAPVAVTGMVERTEDLTATPPTHALLARTRNECKYMM